MNIIHYTKYQKYSTVSYFSINSLLSSTQPRIFALFVRNKDRLVFKQHWDLSDSSLVSCWTQPETHVRPLLSCRTLEMCHFVLLHWHSPWSFTGTEIFHKFYLLLMQPVSSTWFVFIHTAACLFHFQRALTERGRKLHHLHQEFHPVSKVWIL